MATILFNGIKPKQCVYEVSVVGNAQVDKINFIFTEPLNDLYTLAQLSEFFAFAKLESAGKEYIDKVICESEYEDIVDNQNAVVGHKLTVSFVLLKKSTYWKNLLAQVQFETNEGEIVSQSQIVGLALGGHINADEEISDEYPYAIQQLEDLVLTYNARITNLEDNAVMKSDVPKYQATATIVQNALTNLNGRVLSSYEATLEEGQYTRYVITKGGNRLTGEQAEEYMEYMTGSRFLPTYNYEKPQNTLLIFGSDMSIWKPQYNEVAGNLPVGLYLFKVGGEIVDTKQEQVINAIKTFLLGLNIGSGGRIFQNNSNEIVIQVATDDKVKIGNYDIEISTDLLPKTNDAQDIGSTSQKWKDIHFANYLRGGRTLTQNAYENLIAQGQIEPDAFYFIEEE